MHVELPSGGSIEIRPVQDLKAKDRDATTAALKVRLKIDDKGQPDLSDLHLGGGQKVVVRNALMARLITAWSFEDEDGQPLPVPEWNASMAVVENEDSIGELPIDAIIDIEAILVPYEAKIDRRPDPKGTTTASSNGTSRAKPAVSPTA